MKTLLKSLLLAATVSTLGLTAARAQYTGIFPPTNDFTAPTPAEQVLRAAQLGSAGLLFGQDLYLNSTLGVSNIFTTWGLGPVPAIADFNPMGGQIRVIYIGKTAGWNNDLGYVTIPPYPHSSYMPLVTDINGSNVSSGSDTIISYGAGQTVDFWINSGGPLNQGGLFYALGLGNEYSGTDNSVHVHWNSAMLNTIDYGPLKTYFIGYEDTRQHSGVPFADKDFNDLMIAIQFLPSSAVPEPSTYGLMGAGALLALVGYRRFKNKAVAKTKTT